MTELKLFPWDNDIKPYWVNTDNGYQWYIDESTSKWCTRETLNNLPILEAVVFYVCEVVDGKIEPISRALIDKKSNNLIGDETSLEAMASKIDMIRVTMSFKN